MTLSNLRKIFKVLGICLVLAYTTAAGLTGSPALDASLFLRSAPCENKHHSANCAEEQTTLMRFHRVAFRESLNYSNRCERVGGA